MQVTALIIDSFRHAMDKKLFWVMIAISTAIAAAFGCVGATEAGGLQILGKWTIAETNGRAMAALILSRVVCDYYVGWIGIILALIATAGIIPEFLNQGSVDVVLSKPISRWKLFLGKYLGSMSFAGLQAAYFVVLTFFVAGFRWNIWLWSYFWAVPLIMLLFSYVYAFCAFFGVLTRSSLASLLLTMLVWFALWGLQNAYVLTRIPHPFDYTKQEPMLTGRWANVLRVTHTAIPKTQDIPYIAGKLTGAASLADTMNPEDMSAYTSHPDPEVRRQFRQLEDRMEADRASARDIEDVNIPWSIGTSLGCEAVVVLLAMVIFWRRDY